MKTHTSQPQTSGPKCGELRVDLGCGPQPSEKCNFGLDLHDYSKLYENNKDFKFFQLDFEKGVIPLCTNSAHYLVADNVLEHINNLIPFMNECWRILKKGYEFSIIVPYATSNGSLSDPTHVRFFTEKTFHYFRKSLRQENYGIKPWIIKAVPASGMGRIEIILTPDK